MSTLLNYCRQRNKDTYSHLPVTNKDTEFSTICVVILCQTTVLPAKPVPCIVGILKVRVSKQIGLSLDHK